MWALGTIFYKMLCGRMCFAGSNRAKVMGKIQDKSFEFPEGTEVSAEAIDLLE